MGGNQSNILSQFTGLQRFNPMQIPQTGQQGGGYQRPTQQTYQPYLQGTFASRNPGFTQSSPQTSLANIIDMLYGGPGTPSGTPGVDAGMDASNAGSGVSASDSPGSVGNNASDGVGGPDSPGGW